MSCLAESGALESSINREKERQSLIVKENEQHDDEMIASQHIA
jgi:hypothetical protein